MSWLPSFLTKNSYETNVFASVAGWFGYGNSSGTAIGEKESLQISAVFCAVRVIAEGIAQMPLNVKRREVKNGKEFTTVATDHSAQKLLTVKPNGWMTPYEFVEFMIFISALYGDFVAIKNTVKGDVRELLPLVPGSWTVKRLADHSLVYEVSGVDKKIIGKYKQKEVLHLRGPSLDATTGLKPIFLARDALGLSVSLEKGQASMAANGGRPSGVLSSTNPIKPENAEAIKANWTSKFGTAGAGGVALLDGGWTFSAMQMSSVDSEVLMTRKFQIEEIARVFRVFPQMLMQSDKASTFASAEQFFRAHVTHTLGPWIERAEAVINRDILGSDQSEYFADFDERNLLRGDFKDQAQYYAKALGAGGTPAWMTQNEVRRELGLEPDSDKTSDELFNGFQDNQAPGDVNTPTDDEDEGDGNE